MISGQNIRLFGKDLVSCKVLVPKANGVTLVHSHEAHHTSCQEETHGPGTDVCGCATPHSAHTVTQRCREQKASRLSLTLHDPVRHRPALPVTVATPTVKIAGKEDSERLEED